MNNVDFMKKLASIPEEEPDEIDLKLLTDIKYDSVDTGKALDIIKQERESNGKISLRIPKELHTELIKTAKLQGVSLNQYCLYRLARK